MVCMKNGVGMTIIAERARINGRERIVLTFPYDPGLVIKAKRVPGASFSKAGGPHWSYALDMRVCRSLREQFGADLKVGPELTAWAHEAVKHESAMAELSTASDAELHLLPSVAPVLAEAMGARTYQRVGARFVAEGRAVLLADQPGLGKTLEAIGGIIESGVSGPVLILSLRTALRVVWEAELLRWLPAHAVRISVIDGTGPERQEAIEAYWRAVDEAPELLHFMVCNPEMIRTKMEKEGKATWYTHSFPGLFARPWSGIIIDETAHNQSSLIHNSASEAKMSQFRRGAKHLPLRDGGVKVALSGTPMRGKPRNLWGTLNWLYPDVYTSFWNWVPLYFDVWKEGGAYGVPEHMVIGDLREPDKLYADLSKIMLRRTKSEVLKDLPPKQYGGTPLNPSDPSSPVAVWVPMTPAQAKAYKAMAKDAAVALDGGNLMANGILAELTRLKQFANSHGVLEHVTNADGETVGKFRPALPSNKFDTVVAMLEERGITGKPDEDEGDSQVVIASQFTETIDLFAQGLRDLGIEVAVLTGKTKQKDRDRIIREFQGDGGPRVFLLNTWTGGVALTLDKADDLIILDETWVPDDQEQVEDRIHRASRIHQVTIYYIKSLGTIDEEIAANNLASDTIQKDLMDGRRGVDIARKLLGGK